ncbi:MAG: DUF1064 domain-containing protein [Candidatus Rickettsiella isopodorum]|nr:DUF1064 domain-containing protein [Candidatus Rickettsiella isopodorum]
MWQIKRQNKYNNKKQVYNGRWYHSKKEAAYAEQLDWLIKAKEIKSWKPQVRIHLDINGYHITDYIVDFEVINKDDGKEWHEVKGMETYEWQIKRRILEATILKENQNIKYIVIK